MNNNMLPSTVYTNVIFQVHFYGVYNCPEWVVSILLLVWNTLIKMIPLQHKDPLEKIQYFIDGMSLELSKTCNCHIPVDNFADERLICETKDTNKVVFQSRLVVVDDKNDTQLLDYVKEWVMTDPHVVVQGIQLQVDQYCSVELTELGNSECISTTPPPPPLPPMPSNINKDPDTEVNKTGTAANTSVYVPVSTLAGSVAAIILILIAFVFSTICIAVKCTRAK